MKKILDVCCGSRMFWFDKENPDTIFADNREVETTLCDGRKLLIKPDIKMDFRNMPFEDNVFKVIVFDPPHLKQAGSESWLAKKYGVLPKDWKTYLKAGFDECMRVLEPDGILIFKWNEEQIKLNDVLKEFGKKPLLGDQRGKTRVQRIEGDNLQEKRSRKEQRRDRQQHYEELESRHDAKALERFKRPAYQSVSVAEYLAKKYDITTEVDTIADRRKRNDGK